MSATTKSLPFSTPPRSTAPQPFARPTHLSPTTLTTIRQCQVSAIARTNLKGCVELKGARGHVVSTYFWWFYLSTVFLRQEVKDSVALANVAIKERYDAKYKPISFCPGDMVFLRLHHGYVVPGLGSKKLSHQREGPFRVEARVGRLAYRLALPPNYKIHPVISVAQLEPAVTIPIATWTSEVGAWHVTAGHVHLRAVRAVWERILGVAGSFSFPFLLHCVILPDSRYHGSS